MFQFRLLLCVILFGVVSYTGIVISNHGWGLFEIFFGDISAMTWPGQFNLDFLCFLILTGFWVAWRNNFTLVGNSLGILMLIGGSPLLCLYLLIISFSSQGRSDEILRGKIRADRKGI